MQNAPQTSVGTPPALRTLVYLTAMLCVVHAVMQAIGSWTFWAPCFAEGFGNLAGYDSDECMYLQYEAETPLWMHLGHVWLLEMALSVMIVVFAMTRAARRWAAGVAVVLIALSNPLIDYVVAIPLNGGYSSADAAPTFGLFGAALLLAAVPFLLLVPVRAATSSARRP